MLERDELKGYLEAWKMNRDRALSVDFQSDSREFARLVDPECETAVVLVQAYAISLGLDLAVWERTTGDVRRSVLATGPLTPVPNLEHVRISNDTAIPRSERIAEALQNVKQEMGDNLRCQDGIDVAALVDTVVKTTIDEFEAAAAIVASTSDGCMDVVGIESAVRAFVFKKGSVVCESKSWGGEMDPETYWGNLNRLLQTAMIDDLDGRRI